MLQAHSQISYPASFTGNTREVALTGEAYFDIAPNEKQPFIIHTGKVKTTVLGTAFNINANSDEVVVSVTTGRVRVEDETKLLAVLAADQQVTYRISDALTAQQAVDARMIVTGWTG